MKYFRSPTSQKNTWCTFLNGLNNLNPTKVTAIVTADPDLETLSLSPANGYHQIQVSFKEIENLMNHARSMRDK
jgi:hypothetical protein